MGEGYAAAAVETREGLLRDGEELAILHSGPHSCVETREGLLRDGEVAEIVERKLAAIWKLVRGC